MRRPATDTALRVMLVNCGRGGLRATNTTISSLLEWYDADVACVCETHARAAAVDYTRDNNTVLMSPRAVASVHEYGGVAVIVRADSSRVVSAHIVSAFDKADVLTVDVTDTWDSVTRLVVVYLPPVNTASDCQRGTCTGQACDRSHAELAMQHIRDSMQDTTDAQNTIVLGDMNARVQRRPTDTLSGRWSMIQRELIRAARCTLQNPSEDGVLAATRAAYGAESTLDVVLTPRHNTKACSVLVSRERPLSDHFNMLIDLRASAPRPTAPSDRYGMQSDVPNRFRTRWTVLRMDAEAIATFQAALATTTASATASTDYRTASTSERDTMLDGLLASAAISTGVAQTTRTLQRERITPTHRALVRESQRQRRAHAADPQHPSVLAAGGALATSDSAMRDRLNRAPARAPHVAPGVSRHSRSWPATTTVMPPSRAQWEGSAHAKTKASRPTRLIQQELRALETGLRSKYAPQPAQDLRAWGSRSDHPAEPPTLQEIMTAMSALSTTSACIGIPGTVFQAAMHCQPFASAVCELITAVWKHPEAPAPASWTTNRTSLIHKQGDKKLLSNYRVIAVGTLIGKLVQTIIDARVRALVEEQLDPCQFGFRPGLSAIQASFVFQSVMGCAQLQQRPLDAVFMDITGAYPSTRHEQVLQALVNARVDSGTLSMVARLLAGQTLFASIGNLNTHAIHQTIGLAEGGPASPILYLLTVDPATSAVRQCTGYSGRPPGMLTGASATSTIPHVSFADDTVTITEPPDTQLVMDVFALGFSQRGYSYNHKPGKTEAFLTSASAAPTLVGVPLRSVESYKHLGVWCHKRGRRASAKAHVQAMEPKAKALVARVCNSRLAHWSPTAAIQVYTAELLPTVTYGVHLACDVMPPCVYVTESTALRFVWQAPNCAIVVLRLLSGLQTPHTRVQTSTMCSLLKMLTLPSTHPVRQQLRLESALYWARADGPGSVTQRLTINSTASLWLASVYMVCADMDAAIARMRGDHTGSASWLNTIRTAVQSERVMTATEYTATREQCKVVLAGIDCARHVAAIHERPSLKPIQHVLASIAEAGRHAVLFNNDRPSPAHIVRRLALSGWQEWATHRHKSRYKACVWCGWSDNISAWHMYAECVHFEEQRLALWHTMRHVAVQSGLCAHHEVQSRRADWSFITLGIKPPAHNPGDGFTTHAKTREAQQRLDAHYRGLMHMADAFVIRVRAETLQTLEMGHDMQEQDPTDQRVRAYYRDDNDCIRAWWLPHTRQALPDQMEAVANPHAGSFDAWKYYNSFYN